LSFCIRCASHVWQREGAVRIAGVCCSVAAVSDEVAVIGALVLMLAAGGDCLDDMKQLAADKGLCGLRKKRKIGLANRRQLPDGTSPTSPSYWAFSPLCPEMRLAC
jgi:hypothetical protein